LTKSNSAKRKEVANHGRRFDVVAILFMIEGILFAAFAISRTFITPLNVSNVPADVGAAIYGFLLLMLVAGAYLVFRSYSLIAGRISIASVRISTSFYFLPLWLLPAFFAMQTGANLLAAPEPEGFHPDGIYLVQVGFFFAAIGVSNLSSIALLIIKRRRKR